MKSGQGKDWKPMYNEVVGNSSSPDSNIELTFDVFNTPSESKPVAPNLVTVDDFPILTNVVEQLKQ